jgi:hypothetical protein
MKTVALRPKFCYNPMRLVGVVSSTSGSQEKSSGTSPLPAILLGKHPGEGSQTARLCPAALILPLFKGGSAGTRYACDRSRHLACIATEGRP